MFRNVTFFTVPKRMLTIKSLSYSTSKQTCVCSIYFRSSDFSLPLYYNNNSNNNNSNNNNNNNSNVFFPQKSIEEKLESALKSKTYFKEQWARTVREINCIRNEHQQNIHIQSKRDKEELRNVG
jgi:hypothetical protein